MKKRNHLSGLAQVALNIVAQKGNDGIDQDNLIQRLSSEGIAMKQGYYPATISALISSGDLRKEEGRIYLC